MMPRTPFRSPGTPATPNPTHKDGTAMRKYGNNQKTWRDRNPKVHLSVSSLKGTIRTNPNINRDYYDVQQVMNMTDRNLHAFFGDGDDDPAGNGAGKTVGFGMFESLKKQSGLTNMTFYLELEKMYPMAPVTASPASASKLKPPLPNVFGSQNKQTKTPQTSKNVVPSTPPPPPPPPAVSAHLCLTVIHIPT